MNHLGIDRAYSVSHYYKHKMPMPGTLSGYLHPGTFKYVPGTSKYEGYDTET